MSRSVLLQLARDSIEEVLQAQNSIDKNLLLQKHPLLGERIPTTINIYFNKKLRGSCSNSRDSLNLLYAIIINAKKAAFEDKEFSPLSTSEYLSCEVEIVLNTPEGVISERDPAILKD